MFRKPAGQEHPEIPQRRREDEVGVQETVIATGTRVHGTIQGRNRVRVAGFLEGEIRSEDLVCIEEHGEVEGSVTAREMIIAGQVRGNLDSSERIDVRASGRVTGNIRCNTLAVAEGGFLHGEITMPAAEGRPRVSVETRASPQDESEPETGDGIRGS